MNLILISYMSFLVDFRPKMACRSRKLITTKNRQMDIRVITRLAAHNGDATHPLLEPS